MTAASSSSGSSSGSSSASTSPPPTPPSASTALPPLSSSKQKDARHFSSSVIPTDFSFRRKNDVSAVASSQARPRDTFHTLSLHSRFSFPSSTAADQPYLQSLVAPHIESFNALTSGDSRMVIPGMPNPFVVGEQAEEEGLLAKAMREVGSKVIFDGRGEGRGSKLEMWVDQVQIGRPMVPEREKMARERAVYPSEARERLTTYKARMTARVCWRVNDGHQEGDIRELGMAPIMVRSNRCNLQSLTSSELVRRKEESTEMGGYFVINGNERLIRFLIVPRANHVIALTRPSFANRGPSYTQYGCQIRSTRPDMSSHTNTVHYLDNGGVTLRFSWRKQEYMIPIMMVLKALVNPSDKEIFVSLMSGAPGGFDNTFLSDRVELLLRGFQTYGLWTGEQCLEFLGDKFKVVLGCPEDWSNVEVGRFLMKKIVLVHLDDSRDKFNLLIFMIQKLYALVAGECCADNPDSPQHQEVLLPGFLYGQIIKERVDEYITNVRTQIGYDIRRKSAQVDFRDNGYIKKILGRVNSDVGGRLANFLATGNLISPTGLDLQQTSGFTIVAEKLNFYRYLSHFRCIHRGAFFAELKTTTVRKLLPEAWGFLCPVHTPDGSPCGLLNHLSHTCKIITMPLSAAHVPQHLTALGMEKSRSAEAALSVQLDGRIIGWASPRLASRIATTLRTWKTAGRKGIPLDMEIGFVPVSKGGQYPGLYLFSGRARMMRPVTFLDNGKTDHVGPFEQVYLDIACVKEEIEKGVSTHVEEDPTNVLSVIANLTPFSDFNQSPRNMYQCQMGKQTMGTPASAIARRTDNKLYRLQTGQTPVVRPVLHDKYGFDDFPNGTNAVVAVISYTGYDMEDAMILNKSAHERGFGYGTVYKSEVIDLRDAKGASANRSGPSNLHFGFGPDVRPTHPAREELDEDGIVAPGTKIKQGSVLCAYYDETTHRTRFQKHKGDETAYVDTVRLLGGDAGDSECLKLHIMLRIPRSPVIGDKFSSRHGQKGVCSQKWPAVDMPFSESGMQPDVIINPHAFPSRMTIGMFVESLAGKAGALHGVAQDATPFKYSEDDTPVDHFGKQLLAAGYNYHGNEPMYSGITGQEFAADIYLGVVYYQRLRHMVNDKHQVRTTGPVHSLTRQPDRLMNCSDYSTAWVCRTCGSLISLGYDDAGAGAGSSGAAGAAEVIDGLGARSKPTGPNGEYCRVCRAEEEERERKRTSSPSSVGVIAGGMRMPIGKENVLVGGETGSSIALVAVPYVLKLLVAELAAMGMKISFEISDA